MSVMRAVGYDFEASIEIGHERRQPWSSLFYI